MLHTVFTIGHSTRAMEEFIALLLENEIKVLADIRHFPGSRKYPHFNKENLEQTLNKENIQYVHFVDLGGRRKPSPDSKHIAWRHPAFRAYADYMDTKQFQEAAKKLEKLASQQRTVYMCSEAVWWRCHRSMLSDYLKAKGWNVLHIMSPGKFTEHPYTSPAKIINGELEY